ncbi:hypothetical protein ACFFUB_02470 [Algimonas porphyrae]|uniref:Uncharacterized protein n=1 Tax=Algimonas porphyrae TaxID=1128113 RepID=A0ABQ5V2B1_9PROT|nr:hypothetical protein [Algimonas porphyrae]GLQ20377.1 hypothetical protein GCM10007854_13320 [Algimonas porphyrae]
MQKQHFIVIHERVGESIVKDAVTLLIALIIIALSWRLDLAAFEWVGAIIFLMTSFTAGSRYRRFSLDEARSELDRIQGTYYDDIGEG